jgi:hypothetical protein
MTALLVALLVASLRAVTRSRLELAAEILALRYQLAVLNGSGWGAATTHNLTLTQHL